MKRIPLTVDCCEKCPYLTHRDNIKTVLIPFPHDADICRLTGKDIGLPEKLPAFCPLEDVKE